MIIRSASSRSGAAVPTSSQGSGSLSHAGSLPNSPPTTDAKRFTTGTSASSSTPLRYSAASTATFIVLAASCSSSGSRTNTGSASPAQGATTTDSMAEA